MHTRQIIKLRERLIMYPYLCWGKTGWGQDGTGAR